MHQTGGKNEGMNSCVPRQSDMQKENQSSSTLPGEVTCYFPGQGVIAIGHTLLEKITYPIKSVTFEDDDFPNFPWKVGYVMLVSWRVVEIAGSIYRCQ